MRITDSPETIYGCSAAEAARLNGNTPIRQRGSAARLYAVQRNNAKRRCVAWEITFAEWLEFWDGNLDKRGKGVGKLCMSRIGDVGPYKVGNIFLNTQSENSRETMLRTMPRPKNPKPCDTLGMGRGWTLIKNRNTDRPYLAKLCGKAIGQFATPSEAEHAYQMAAAAKRAERGPRV